MAKRNVVETVKGMLADFLPQNGYELWHAEFTKEGKDYNLKVFVDAPAGIGTDDCEKVSRYLSARLDEVDLIEMPYSLIVSSPGMDRPLLTAEHFRRYAGSPVDVTLYRGVDGRKAYSGILRERTEEYLTLETEAGDVKLPLASVSKVRLQVIL
jgi:ribosome maturation factor RimP